MAYFAAWPPRPRSIRTSPRLRQIAPVQIRANERITFGSDSLTTGYNGALAWPTGTGNFNDQVNALLGSGNQITAVQNGQPGSGIDYLHDNLSTLIFASDPTCVILLTGVNDAVAYGQENSFVDKYVKVLALIKTWKPAVKIICIGVGPRESEVWSTDSGGRPIWNPAQPSLDTFDAYVQQAATAMGCPFVPWRQKLLAWEVTNNPTQAALGFATLDGTHFTDAGQKQLAAAVLDPAICTVFP